MSFYLHLSHKPQTDEKGLVLPGTLLSVFMRNRPSSPILYRLLCQCKFLKGSEEFVLFLSNGVIFGRSGNVNVIAHRHLVSGCFHGDLLRLWHSFFLCLNPNQGQRNYFCSGNDILKNKNGNIQLETYLFCRWQKKGSLNFVSRHCWLAVDIK